ncbi:DUF192 domain-containing protein [Candidatus Woesearchaeota archaeon]|nr:DUF192 domain-containing protein [Candidatus Woesearchaeota archaeon]
MRKTVIILCIVLFSLVAGCKTRDVPYTINNHVDINGQRIFVEIPKTSEEMMKGLMFRQELCDNCGMLFIFEHEDFHGFWMKNTLIPLDMVFINTNLYVVDVLHAAPCTEDPCRSYVPGEKALYVLEVNPGKFDESIIGEKINIVIS